MSRPSGEAGLAVGVVVNLPGRVVGAVMVERVQELGVVKLTRGTSQFTRTPKQVPAPAPGVRAHSGGRGVIKVGVGVVPGRGG